MNTLKPGSALGVALALALSAASAHADSIVNGGFESGTTAPWVTTGGIGLSALGSGKAPEGSHVGLIDFNSVFEAPSGAISQTFTTANAGLFQYAFDAGRSEPFCGCNDVALTFAARIDGVLLSDALPAFDPAGSNGPLATSLLSHYSGSLMLGAGSHELSFAFSRAGSLFGRAPFFVLDAVQGTSLATPPTGTPGVPEPATWAMMIAGFGLAGGALRRRRYVVVA
jgi:hypothetical protein